MGLKQWEWPSRIYIPCPLAVKNEFARLARENSMSQAELGLLFIQTALASDWREEVVEQHRQREAIRLRELAEEHAARPIAAVTLRCTKCEHQEMSRSCNAAYAKLKRHIEVEHGLPSDEAARETSEALDVALARCSSARSRNREEVGGSKGEGVPLGLRGERIGNTGVAHQV